MNQFIKNLIPLLFLILVYIILFLDQDNNPYNKILKLDLKKSKNTFQANDLDDIMPVPIMHYKLDKKVSYPGLLMTEYSGYYKGRRGDNYETIKKWFDSTKPSKKKIVSSISFSETRREYFSQKYSGIFKPSKGGTYKFTLASDDASFLVIDDNIIIDNGNPHARTVENGTLEVSQGGEYEFEIYFGEQAGKEVLEFTYKKPDETGVSNLLEEFYCNILTDNVNEPNGRNGLINEPIFELINANTYKNNPIRAIKFNGGNDDYIEIPPKSTNLEEDILSAIDWDGFSFAGWIYWEFNNNVPVSWSRIFDFGENTDLNNLILANKGNTRNLHFTIRNGKWSSGNRDNIDVKNYLEEGKWIHVAVTFSNKTSKVKIYKNSKVVAEKDMKQSNGEPLKIEYRNRQKAYIGKSNWGHDPNFKGQMSNLYFFNQELSTSHIESLYEGTYNTTPNNDLKSNKTENTTTVKSKSIDDIQINPNWLRFFEIK